MTIQLENGYVLVISKKRLRIYVEILRGNKVCATRGFGPWL